MKNIAFRFASRVWIKTKQDSLSTEAAALAYTTLASLVPLLAVAFFLFKSFGGFKVLEERLEPWLAANLAPSFGEQILGVLNGIETKISGGALGVFGLIGFLVTAILTLSNIERAFNKIWGSVKSRPWRSRLTTYWSLLTLGPLLLGLSLFVSAEAHNWLKEDNGEIAKVLLFFLNLLPFFLSGILFSFLFYILPNTSVSWKNAWRAGLATGIIFEAAKKIYSLYARNSLAGANVYGSLAILPLFLLWIYVAWWVVLLGAEVCVLLGSERE